MGANYEKLPAEENNTENDYSQIAGSRRGEDLDRKTSTNRGFFSAWSGFTIGTNNVRKRPSLSTASGARVPLVASR